MNSNPWIQERADGVLLSLRVQPRASRNEIVGTLGGELKVKVTAPPVDSAANEAVLRLLAEKLGCPRHAVQLVRGATARRKQVHIAGISAAAVATKLS